MMLICNNINLKTKLSTIRHFIISSTIDMIDKTIETKEMYQEKMIYLQKKNQTVHLFSYQ